MMQDMSAGREKRYASPVAPAATAIRCLLPWEGEQFRRHLLRLDALTRGARFGCYVGDGWLSRYANETNWLRDAVLGYWVEHEVRGVVELRRIGDGSSTVAEVALSIEAPFQDCGLGTILASRIVRIARSRGMRTLRFSVQGTNVRILRIVGKLGGHLQRFCGHLDGEITLCPDSEISL